MGVEGREAPGAIEDRDPARDLGLHAAAQHEQGGDLLPEQARRHVERILPRQLIERFDQPVERSQSRAEGSHRDRAHAPIVGRGLSPAYPTC